MIEFPEKEFRLSLVEGLTRRLRGVRLSNEEAWFIINAVCISTPGGLPDLIRKP